MFDFLKKKIKDSINSIQKRLSKEEKVEEAETEKEQIPEKIVEAPIERPARKEERVEEPSRKEIEEKKETDVQLVPAQVINIPAEKPILKEEHIEESESKLQKEEITLRGPKRTKEPERKEKTEKTPAKEHREEKKHRLFSHKINKEDISSLYESIREGLAENNVAVSVLEAIHEDLQKKLIGKEVSFLSNKKEIENAIKASIADVMSEYSQDKLMSDIQQKKPYIILFIGVNGAGKTTTLAKLIRFFSKKGLKTVVSASDTFRAASIEQLETHTKRLGVKIIKHNYGADPAAVAFDAIKHANSDGSDLVLIDTAGRSDINKNLLDELKKVKRVSKPDLTIFIGDALTGNDAVNQAQIFDREIGIDATILSKADVDKKGGAVISISYITKKPIMFLGTGQGYDDLTPFDKEKTAEFLLE